MSEKLLHVHVVAVYAFLALHALFCILLSCAPNILYAFLLCFVYINCVIIKNIIIISYRLV